MNLELLAGPFPTDDIEWRISRSGTGGKGIWCTCLAYITARAIQSRLDDVCGPVGWRLEEPQVLNIDGKSAFACGISIYTDAGQWITKWDVCEPTRSNNIDAAKGGWSGAMKRAGAQWGIGRYLYHLDEVFADVAERSGGRNWNYAKLSEKNGGDVFYWKTPSLPGWALPKEADIEVSESQLGDLKQTWRAKFCPNSRNPKELRDGFERFVLGVSGEFPVSDNTCWTRDALDACMKRIEETTEPNGVDSDIPFAAE